MRWIAFFLLCANLMLWLLAENSALAVAQHEPVGRLPRVAELAPEVPPGFGALRYCVTVGWFDELARAADATEQLKRTGFSEAVVREVERPEEPLYWVLVPPAKTYGEALESLRDIQRQGIDSYLVVEGAKKNAISLGLFKSKIAAEKLLEERNKKNLHATLVLFPRNRLSYALDFEASYVPESEELAKAGAELMQQFELVEVKRCEGVATAAKTP